MIVINPTELRANQKKYFDLAERERVVIKRGSKLIELKVTSSISPSNDPYFDDLNNVFELKQRLKNIEEGKETFSVLTEDDQKKLLKI